MLSEKLLDILQERRAKVLAGGGDDKLQERHAKGLMGARERLLNLFQPDTFQEIGTHAKHAAKHFGLADKELPSDGVIVGTGFVDGRPVAAFSQDFTVMGGTLGKMHAKKIVQVMQMALKTGTPVVAFKDSAGARIQEAVDALSGYGEVFYNNVLVSGVVPQIAIIAGPCAGGASYSPALMDYIIMTRQNAYMFITGPEVIKAVTGRTTSLDEVGSALMHATVSGNVHFIADDDRHAIQIAKALLSYLPSNNTEDPPHRPYPDLDLSPDHGIDALIRIRPPSRWTCSRSSSGWWITASFLKSTPVGRVISLSVSPAFKASWSACWPISLWCKAGAMDIDASDKGARFIRFCNAFNIPLVTLVDVPGFLPGIEQERGGIIRHGAKMLYTYASATVPKITIILRKAYGGSYLAMCAQEMGADVVYAWPTAEIAVMGAEGAVNILYRNELKDAPDRKAKAKELADEYRAKFASPYMSASRGYITDVIEPADTRATITLALRKLLTKRELRPAKKHGDIPL
jgi:acetyl-CoA carboxylase carboxyltransferase component